MPNCCKKNKVNESDVKTTFRYPVQGRVPGQNAICTSHYKWYNFVFLNLFEQYCRPANWYFLFNAILQSIPQITPLDSKMAFVGLIFMLGLSMAKAGFEDLRRHKADDAINSKEIKLWNPSGNHEKIKWTDIQQGDIIMVENDTEFPADCIILEVPSSDKRCRILTAALDGETDIKYKKIVTDEADLKNMTFDINMRAPEQSLGIFSGTLQTQNNLYPLTINNFVPRGCVLTKTNHALALVLYTGENTKIIMNSTKPHPKKNDIDRFLSLFVFISIFLMIFLCVLFTVLSFQYTKEHIADGYLQLEEMPKIFYFLNIFSWNLVLSHFIPLSLYSSLDIVRFFISIFFAFDNQLVDENGRRCTCKNSDLIYSIGKVTHIFSDKTGTLTKNLMTFKVVGFHDNVIGTNIHRQSDEDTAEFSEFSREEEDEEGSYYFFEEEEEEEVSEALKTLKQKVDMERLHTFKPEHFNFLKENINNRQDVFFFLHTVILCHNAMTSVNPNYYDLSIIKAEFPDFEFTYELPPPEVVARFPYIITYSTASPDELCLIHIARDCGYILYDSQDKTVKVIIDGKLTVFERPVSFDYASHRKRGSCIAKIGEKYFMLMKGADSVISELCTNRDSQIFEFVQTSSNIGLRTLVYAVKEIEDVEPIIDRYERIKMMTTGDVEAEINNLAEENERDLEVIAFTGVEDELQDEVDIILEYLKLADIKIWMLTGDKISTAIKIGKTTSLIEADNIVVVLDYSDLENHFEKLKNIPHDKTVIALEGSLFRSILSYEDETTNFFTHTSKCAGVIMARCEPSQKGDVVRSFKKFDKKKCVLAIGDGANDVDMIREADVGIGVEGSEGSEAVMSSDFSIPSFKFLRKLLLVYGHWCIHRITILIEATLYKNVIMSFFQIYYGINNGFSATDTFDSMYLSFYNMLLTVPQLFYNSVIEQDLNGKYLVQAPQIYAETRKSGGLTIIGILRVYLLSAIHSAIIYYFSVLETNNVVLDSFGKTFDYAIFTQVTGWSLLFVFTAYMILRFETISIFHIILYAICDLIYLLLEFIYSHQNDMFIAIVPIIFTSPRTFFTIPFCICLCVMIDLIVIYLKRHFAKKIIDDVHELEYSEIKQSRNIRNFFRGK